MKLTEEELKYARQEAKERIREKIATRKEQFENFKNDPSIASKIVKNRDHIMKVFIVLFVICLISTLFVKVNYDLTEYLPEDVTSKKAIDIMEEEFGYPGTARILIEDVSIYEAELYKEMIEDVEGVDMVAWMSSDVYMSGDFIEADDQTDYYKNNCAVMDVTFEKGDTDELTKDAIDEIKKILGEKGHYGGPAVENKSLEETLNVQIAIITVIAVIMIFIILCLTTNSWAEPVLFLIVMGVAIILNMGTNLILGTISFISNSVAAILQLAISIDSSIFLLHTYIKEQKTEPNREKAMTNALKHSALSILSSGMTTFVGFMALLFMRFSIGKDIGIVLGKSIICSILTVMLLMPSLILRFEPLIERTQHKTIIPSFKKPAKFIFKLRYFIVGLIIVVALPTFLMQNSNVNTFGNSALGASEGTVVYEDEQMIESLFGRSNLYLIMVPNGSPVMERELAGELKDLYYVRSVTALSDILPVGVPEEIVPSSVTDLLRSDNYTRMLLYTKTKSESDLAFETSDEIQAIVKSYYPENSYVVGNTPSTQDLKTICTSDYMMVNILSLIGVAIVVGVAFKSIILPIIVLIPINIAIYINMSVPYLQGKVFMFAAFVVVCCIQLGATVDYSILLTNNYLDRRKTMKPAKAAVKALEASLLSILTSGAILTVAGYGIYFVVSVEAIRDIGHMLGRGALLSMLMVILAIPALLTMLDKLILKEAAWKERRLEKKAEKQRNEKSEKQLAKIEAVQAKREKAEEVFAERLENREYKKVIKEMLSQKKLEEKKQIKEEREKQQELAEREESKASESIKEVDESEINKPGINETEDEEIEVATQEAEENE